MESNMFKPFSFFFHDTLNFWAYLPGRFFILSRIVNDFPSLAFAFVLLE